MIRGINHLTFAVADVARAVHFYTEVLGLDLATQWATGAYLRAGPTWVALSHDPATRTAPHADYTHVAFDVAPADFDALAARITASGATVWKTNTSEGPSLYFLDPDGHKLEVHASTLEARLASMA